MVIPAYLHRERPTQLTTGAPDTNIVRGEAYCARIHWSNGEDVWRVRCVYDLNQAHGMSFLIVASSQRMSYDAGEC